MWCGGDGEAHVDVGCGCWIITIVVDFMCIGTAVLHAILVRTTYHGTHARRLKMPISSTYSVEFYVQNIAYLLYDTLRTRKVLKQSNEILLIYHES